MCWYLFLFLYLLLPPLVSQAATVYVDGDVTRCAGCSDSNTYVQMQTITTGARTWNGGINRMVSGDTLVVRGDSSGNDVYLEYDEVIADSTADSAIVKIPPNGIDADNYTIITTYQNERVSLRPAATRFTGTPSNGIIHFYQTATPRKWIRFQGVALPGFRSTFRIDARTCSANDNQVCFGTLIHTANNIHFKWIESWGGRHSSHLVVDNQTSSTPTSTIPTAITYEHVYARDCAYNVSAGTGVAGHCFYLSSSGNTIIDSYAQDSGGSCYHNYGNTTKAWRNSNDNTILRNICTNNSRISDGADSAYVISGDRNLVANNLCFNCRHSCFSTKYKNAANNELYFNTCAGLTEVNFGGFHVNADAQGTTLRNNLCWNGAVATGTSCYNDQRVTAPLTTQDHNLFGTADPLWVTNYTNTNTQTGSPARSAGVTVSGITDDLSGNTRDGSPDIGAREFLDTPVSPLVLIMSTPPVSGTLVGATFNVVAGIYDAQSALQDLDSGDCTLAKTTGSGTLAGCTLTVTPTDGLCTWTGCTIDAADDDYTLTASRASTTSAVSPIFTIISAPVATSTIRLLTIQ